MKKTKYKTGKYVLFIIIFFWGGQLFESNKNVIQDSLDFIMPKVANSQDSTMVFYPEWVKPVPKWVPPYIPNKDTIYLYLENDIKNEAELRSIVSEKIIKLVDKKVIPSKADGSIRIEIEEINLILFKHVGIGYYFAGEWYGRLSIYIWGGFRWFLWASEIVSSS